MEEVDYQVTPEGEVQESSASGGSVFATLIIFGAACYLGYAIFASQPWNTGPNWDILESPLCGPLFLFGFVKSIMGWIKGKRHYSTGDQYEKITYSDGSEEIRKNRDMVDSMHGNIIMPLLMHLIVEPLFWACIIYYPLMLLWSLVHGFIPYVLALVLIVVVCLFYSYSGRFSATIAIIAALCVGGGFVWGANKLLDKRAHEQELVAKYAEVLEAEGVDYDKLDSESKLMWIARLEERDKLQAADQQAADDQQVQEEDQPTEAEAAHNSEPIYRLEELDTPPAFSNLGEIGYYIKLYMTREVESRNIKHLDLEAEVVIDKDGNMINPVLTKVSDNQEINDMFMRQIKLNMLTKWHPGKINGEAVNCYYPIHVTFDY